MQGLVNTAIQGFVTATYGPGPWQALLARAGLGDLVDGDGFDSMASYDDWTTAALLSASAPVLGRSRDVLLEDLGTFLISNPALDPLRRLLRFGGVSFTDFLFSLEDLPARTRMAVPELVLPELSLVADGGEQFTLICQPGTGPLGEGFGFVMVGILRALADDYGALAVIEHLGARPVSPLRGERRRLPPAEAISIIVHDPAFHAGRHFHLAQEGGR